MCSLGDMCLLSVLMSVVLSMTLVGVGWRWDVMDSECGVRCVEFVSIYVILLSDVLCCLCVLLICFLDV